MKIILLVLLTGITSIHAQGIKICITPDNKYGHCIGIKNCTSMVQFLLSKENFTSIESEYLRKYQCGYEKGSPNVCCPNNGITVSGLNISPRMETPKMASVKDHINLRLLPTDCGPSGLGDRIHNGNKTKLFEFPWMALLSYQTRSGPSFKCGGTMINDRYILTAAHCIKDNLLGIRLGEHSILNSRDCETDEDDETYCAEPVQDFFIDEAIVHSSYNQPHRAANDIALIRVVYPIRTSKSVAPICLPIEEEVIANINQKPQFTVTGWGATENSQSSDDLLQANIAPVPLEECQKTYKKMSYTITETQICAKSINGSDSCNGDSGGPIQTIESVNSKVRYVQGGIVSIGPNPCANKEIPGVYTKIDKYINWILDNITD